MGRLTIHMDEALARAIRRLAADRRCARAQVVRDAVAEYLRANRRPKAKGIGACGRTDVSDRAEELLRAAARIRVRVPLIRSKRPGQRNLTNAEIEELLS